MSENVRGDFLTHTVAYYSCHTLLYNVQTNEDVDYYYYYHYYDFDEALNLWRLFEMFIMTTSEVWL